MVSATHDPNMGAATEGQWNLRSVMRLGSIDHTICSSLASSASVQRVCMITLPRLSEFYTAAKLSGEARATATATSLGGLRLSKATSHGEARLLRPIRTARSIAVAPTTSALRN